MFTMPARLPLHTHHHVLVSHLPDALAGAPFDRLWELHPPGFHHIRMGGRVVATPRWQQAYGRDYRYTGQVNRALPIPPLLEPWLAFARTFEPLANGLLLNWYDGAAGHYIGPHRDATAGLVPGTAVVTLSLGARRIFRFRPWRTRRSAPDPDAPPPHYRVELDTGVHPVIVFGWDVNAAWTHEVPRGEGRRISLTARAFS